MQALTGIEKTTYPYLWLSTNKTLTMATANLLM